MSQNIKIVKNKIVHCRKNTDHVFLKIKLRDKNYTIDISSESIIENYINHFFNYTHKDSIFNKLKSQYLLDEMKKPDWATDVTKLEKDAIMIELKQGVINEKVIYETVFKTYRDNRDSSISSRKEFSRDKKYFSRYKKHCADNNKLLNKLILYFIAPKVTIGAMQVANEFNLLSSECKIKCLTLEHLFNKLLNYHMVDSNNFLSTKLPFINIDSDTIAKYLKEGKVTII